MNCCFFISKYVLLTNHQCKKLITILDDLIAHCYVKSFQFANRNDCHPVCLAILMELQKKYPHIQLMIHASTQSSSKKNIKYAMIDDCLYCIFYYNEQQKGSKLAFEYAVKKKKVVINLTKKD